MNDGAPAKPWYDLVIQTLALKGWTKAELTDRSGVAKTTVDGWRRNPRKPQAAKVNAVADVLGIPRERALRLAGVITAETPEADRSPPAFQLRKGTREAIQRDLGDEGAAEVIAFVEHLASGRIAPARGARPPEDGQGDQRMRGLARGGHCRRSEIPPSRRRRTRAMSWRPRRKARMHVHSSRAFAIPLLS